MDDFVKALDDIDGLMEALTALSDGERKCGLLRNTARVKQLRHELAAAADAYAKTVMSTHRGEFDAKRLKACRGAAVREMPSALRERTKLAALVSERRVSAPAIRHDVERLLGMSLHFRSALSTFAATVDRRAADALGNKVLVELREATLRYLAVARETADESGGKPRADVIDILKRTEAHARELLAMAPPPDVVGAAPSPGASMSRVVTGELHDTSSDWVVAVRHSETEAA